MNKFILSEKRDKLIFNDNIYYIPDNFLFMSDDKISIYKLITNLKDIKNINYGGFSVVLIYQSLNYNLKIAVKVYKKKNNREIEFYKKIDYKNDKDSKYICEYYGNLNETYKEFNFYYIFLEHMKYDLYDGIFKYKILLINNYKDLINILKSIKYGLLYIHSKNYIYNDLKLENIMINKDGNIKIIDFNCILNYNKINDNQVEFIGTIDYLAPEAFYNNDGYKLDKLKYKSDYWSFGLLIYELLTKKTFPYIHKNYKTTIKNIKKNIFNNEESAKNLINLFFENSNELNFNKKEIENISNLFSKCLKTNPDERSLDI